MRRHASRSLRLPSMSLLLLLLGVLCAPTEAFVSGQRDRQQVEDVLTEKLFAVNRMLGSIQRHVQRLNNWEEAVGGLESRLDVLGAGEGAVSDQAADALQQMEALSETSSAALSKLGSVVTAQESAADALVSLRDGLTQSVVAVAESVSGLASSQAAEHTQTRGACGDSGGAALTAPLTDLRTAVGQITELAQRTAETLGGGLQRVDGRLQETGQQLPQLGQELDEERQARRSSAGSPLGCRDQNNKLVDWYVLYKLPILTSATGFVRKGSAYVHFSSASTVGQWTMSEVSIDTPQSHPGLTLADVYDQPERAGLQYVFYNDQWPDGTTSGTEGHTKGVVAFEGSQGFWMIHSVPRFPPAPRKSKEYSYPSNGYTHGQSLLCITFPTSELTKVNKQVSLNEPYCYDSKDSDILCRPKQARENAGGPYFPSHRDHFTGLHEHTQLEETSSVESIFSIHGSEFATFAKSRNYGRDLYSVLVAPALETSLYAETWRATMPSYCSGRYTVENVRKVTVATASEAFDFVSNKDHSKWAVSTSRNLPWVCVGDVNRADSQTRRGGGTACLRDERLWNVYRQTVTVWEPCA
ncbi:plancitoxin-1-like [Amphibalanus amphitrite]|uniref:plancitoxin-1-like n=1 Tax=Amphibalanus amphitrite TaxID=1232801 RepID=UPI001C8FA88E|nr:plancitoxin-1-like [Amphibalanus amphitrite]